MGITRPGRGYEFAGHQYSGTALDYLDHLIGADATLVHRRFLELDCGQTGGRSLLLRGGTLLHAAAEYGLPDAMALLLEIVECTALGYALLFGGPRHRTTVTLLRERGAVE